MPLTTRCVLLMMSLGLPSFVTAADELPSIEQGALVRGFALPSIGRSEVLESDQWSQRIEFGSINEYQAQTGSGESITVDGEVSRLLYNVQRGFGSGWDAGISIPILIQGGGYLDGLIENWHKAFGLPNAGREDAPRNRYLYQYSRNGQLLLDAHQPSTGFGDVQINTGHSLSNDLAVRALLKIPTGKSSTLAGNGAFGGALWLDGRIPDMGDWLIGGGAGISYTGTGDILPAQQKNWIPFGAAELGYSFTGRFSAQVQVYAHAAPYRDSALSPLAHVGVPLTVSGSYLISNTSTLNMGFQEKTNYGASPDFGIYIGLDWR